MLDPKLLQTDEILHWEWDDGTHEDVTREQIVGAIAEYGEVLQFFADWEDGRFVLSFTEYRGLPAKIVHLRRIYHRVKRGRQRNHI